MNKPAKALAVLIPSADAKLLGKVLALWESDEPLARAAMRGLSVAARKALSGAPESRVIETGLQALPPLKRIASRSALNTSAKLRAEVGKLIREAQAEMRASLTSQEAPAAPAVEAA